MDTPLSTPTKHSYVFMPEVKIAYEPLGFISVFVLFSESLIFSPTAHFLRPKKKKNLSGNMPEKNGSIGRDFFFFFLREALPCKISEHRYTV